jgi:hypothetical protein
MDLFPSSGEGSETHILLGPLEKKLTSIIGAVHPTQQVTPSSKLKTETDPVSETLCFLNI